jgi:hypothetical protein
MNIPRLATSLFDLSPLSRTPLLQNRQFSLLCALVWIAFALPTQLFALGQERYVIAVPSRGSFSLAAGGRAASLVVDEREYPGVVRAAHDLQSDIQRVTGLTPEVVSDAASIRGDAVLIGTISRSPLIDRLIQERKLDVSGITGKWESTVIQVVEKPIPGVPRALVIAGSDKRGTIFGIYDLSEQIGVSPWYWWADVPVHHRAALYVAAGRHAHGEPAVKYRGIFLNDEAPALSGWVNATYGGYNHKFYEKIFELLLRLKANYLWPAMWGSAFNEDDPENAKLADEYGIVMGTSHHEPMLRAQQEWKRHGAGPWDYASNSGVLEKFWNEGIERNKNFESTITIGMRGDGDMPMTEGENIALLEKIVADQRAIIAQHTTPTLAADPQVWALYKEVQMYYEKGMRVPDDVTLLWCDDNWGNIRRLPTPEERNRAGGAGIYYHFDYVGDPRNYKWINTNPIAKVWEQMNLALNYGATKIWIVNVGDLKPMEFPIEFFLTMAGDPQRWGKEQLPEFTRAWAEREFGTARADAIAGMVTRYTQYNGRRKPELLDTDTFSLVNYREADRVEADWRSLLEEAERIQKLLPEDERDAYFELVLHPIKASTIVNELYIAAARNRWYARQGRADANEQAAKARELFQADAQLTDEYNRKLAGGKWNHMMDQTHLGYTYWQEPPLNVMPAVSEVQPLAVPRMGVYAEGTADVNAPMSLSFDNYRRQSRYIDVFNRGISSFRFQATASAPWIALNKTSGEVGSEERLNISVDWDKAPAGKTIGEVALTQEGRSAIKVRIEAFRPESPARESADGFVESDGYVSIEAEHFTAATSAGNARWERIPDYGATLSGMSIFPVTAPSLIPPQAAPTLDYRMYLFDAGSVNLEAIVGPTLNFVPGRGLRFTVAFDDQSPQVVDALAHNSDKDWAQMVSDEVRRVDTTLNVDKPGYHTLKIGMVDPGLVLEKLIVSTGPLKPSYLGPPESFRGLAGESQPKREESPAVQH